MRFLVIGCGSIGRRHTKNLLSLGHKVCVYDANQERMGSLVKECGVSVYDFKSKHKAFDAWVVCTPPVYHIPFAFEALEHNAHIFIEKPLSHNLDKVDELFDRATNENRVVQVGYQFRFNEGLKLMKKLIDEKHIGKLQTVEAVFSKWLLDWHPYEDYRNLYTCHLDQGGGILLDASHEVDYVLWLVNNTVKKVDCIAERASNLETDVEDIADMKVEFENGVRASIHLDMLRHEHARYCMVLGSEGTMIHNFLQTPRKIDCALSHHGLHSYPIPENDPYLDEMKHFIAHIESGKIPQNSLVSAKRTLEIVLAAKQSAIELGSMKRLNARR